MIVVHDDDVLGGFRILTVVAERIFGESRNATCTEDFVILRHVHLRLTAPLDRDLVAVWGNDVSLP